MSGRCSPGSAAAARDCRRRGSPAPPVRRASPLESRYAAKAAELEVATRTVERRVAASRRDGEAGWVPARSGPRSGHRDSESWSEVALEVMVEPTGRSKPPRKTVIERTRARPLARGFEEKDLPGRATAYRLLEILERRHPTFRLSTKRDRARLLGRSAVRGEHHRNDREPPLVPPSC